jgi:uncharacterized protein with HEPN domain
MPKREIKLLLQDIVENAESIFEFTNGIGYEDFINNKMRVYAVVRAFEIIGEAAKIIPAETKAHYPLAEWQLMTDFRNLLTHHYFGIDYEILWRTIKENLPYNYEILKRINTDSI